MVSSPQLDSWEESDYLEVISGYNEIYLKILKFLPMLQQSSMFMCVCFLFGAASRTQLPALVIFDPPRSPHPPVQVHARFWSLDTNQKVGLGLQEVFLFG